MSENDYSEWKEFCEEFFQTWPSAPSFSGLALPKNVKICRDIRRAFLVGTGMSNHPQWSEVQPRADELHDKNLDELSSFGSIWLDAVAKFHIGYDDWHRAGKCPKFKELFASFETWMDWLRENEVFGFFDILDELLQLVAFHRFSGAGEGAFGGVIEKIILAGGIPCGSDGENAFYGKTLFDLPDPFLVYWPWDEEPVIEGEG